MKRKDKFKLTAYEVAREERKFYSGVLSARNIKLLNVKRTKRIAGKSKVA